jgi:hypothetical protein
VLLCRKLTLTLKFLGGINMTKKLRAFLEENDLMDIFFEYFIDIIDDDFSRMINPSEEKVFDYVEYALENYKKRKERGEVLLYEEEMDKFEIEEGILTALEELLKEG